MTFPIFVDTGYVLALVNTADQWHRRARNVAALVEPPFVTTEAILAEVGNALAKRHWRHLGIATLRDLRADPDIEIVAVDGRLFDRAVALYASRPDKEWGVTDCISFALMQDRELTRALTTNRHFAQAGFKSLLFDA